ncbi:MAG: hypothetical protein A3G76_07610 [Acidobacteria bacterium RIFCSPLOWO2_12_FULL_65_11]|nr:MAG: hypothetical protein A3G76_07610 [Acidobacteria bacterium RIFCSPLOWO2_12_FULL_65_11]
MYLRLRKTRTESDQHRAQHDTARAAASIEFSQSVRRGIAMEARVDSNAPRICRRCRGVPRPPELSGEEPRITMGLMKGQTRCRVLKERLA